MGKPSPIKDNLSQVLINSAELVEYQQQGGNYSKTLFIRIPFRSLNAFHKVSEEAVQHLEQKFQWPVIVIATRTIISKRAKRHRTQKRPRSRTLQSVHQAVLEDIVYPATITGRQTRVTLDGKKHIKLFLDPLDKEKAENKLEAMASIYNKITTHKIQIEFAKPNTFQKKVLEQKAAK
mmetsp:Transcript_12075/g.8787  ORF Transcript_12075/g.8787 Transcript_12075/m.8787 type:complete len:178 (-) Transcript_12075:59-592(-)|eukprot:CAMPEP_0202968406 /NCGR_PEP_ID=MMETSP1396-20130829/13671_1 /ASSEMBLY_ACC=CAM_ASM_000872 /TAXON_ID= /ORGANISM="Pseudokeronopsis sp., Strain Brazil" /LENGTH=177 /DNA_ID=CAMNT_0049694665 /DNA_START=140 /DNA_END=673 /DNA_ORIENTATION=+